MLALLPIALMLALLLQQSAFAASSADVDVRDDFFSPTTVTINFGGMVNWIWDGTTQDTHTATDNTGMNLYDSGNVVGGDTLTFPHVFTAAGNYGFRCNIHFGMTGTAKVKPKVSPKSGGTGDSYKISWATQTAPSGFNYDVQRKGPADATWQPFLTNTMTKSFSGFVPDQGVGKYQFRARLQKGTGAASENSPAAKITVS
jgi:plastocyanin